MQTFINSMVLSVVRWALTSLSVWLIAHGVAETIASKVNDAEIVLGIAGAIGTLVWSLWNKYNHRVEVVTALARPKGGTVAELKEDIKAGESAKATTPDTAPPIITKRSRQ